MKKFLEDLKKELNKRNIGQDEINEIISDHEEMIESALAKGLSEQDIITQFGDPANLAEELSDFSDKDTIQENEQSDFQIWKKFEVNKDNVSIVIDLISEDITVQSSEDESLNILYKGSKINEHYECTYEDGLLKLSAKKEIGLFFFRKQNNHVSFLVEIPRSLIVKDFKCKSISSEVIVTKLNAENFTLSTTSGDIEIKGVELGEAKWNTVSGDVDVKNSKIANLYSSQVSGDLSIEKTIITEHLELNTVSGDIELEDSRCDMCELRSVSGDIEAKEFYPQKIAFKSVSGDINIKNSKDTDIEIIKKKSVSGNIKIEVK